MGERHRLGPGRAPGHLVRRPRGPALSAEQLHLPLRPGAEPLPRVAGPDPSAAPLPGARGLRGLLSPHADRRRREPSWLGPRRRSGRRVPDRLPLRPARALALRRPRRLLGGLPHAPSGLEARRPRADLPRAEQRRGLRPARRRAVHLLAAPEPGLHPAAAAGAPQPAQLRPGRRPAAPQAGGLRQHGHDPAPGEGRRQERLRHGREGLHLDLRHRRRRLGAVRAPDTPAGDQGLPGNAQPADGLARRERHDPAGAGRRPGPGRRPALASGRALELRRRRRGVDQDAGRRGRSAPGLRRSGRLRAGAPTCSSSSAAAPTAPARARIPRSGPAPAGRSGAAACACRAESRSRPPGRSASS